MPCAVPPRIAAARAPALRQAAADPSLRRRPSDPGRSGSVSCGVTAPFPGSWCARGLVCALLESLVDMKFDFRCDCAPPPVFSGLLLCPWSWGIFLVGCHILLSMVVQQRVAILVFSQEKMSACPPFSPSGTSSFS